MKNESLRFEASQNDKLKKLYIVGAGMGDEKLLTYAAKEKVSMCKRVLMTKGLDKRAYFKGEAYPINEIYEMLERDISETAVIVSGDAGFYSMAAAITEKFNNIYDIEVINGISCLQYFCGKLNERYDDVTVISLHGRSGYIVPKVSYNKKVFVLTGGGNTVSCICRTLADAGLESVYIAVGERLSCKDERIVEGTAKELSEMEFDRLSVMLIKNPHYKNPHIPLEDEDFIRENVPMTKFDIRQLILSRLKICPDDILYDIGAGTGSVSIEMARKANCGMVYAFEKNKEACNLIEKNKYIHGAYNVKVIDGEASSAIESIDNLPMPNKAFIGGSSGNIDAVISGLIAKNANIKIVITTVTTQTLLQVLNGRWKNCISDMVCVNVSKSKKMGNYDMMIAQNPVYIITLCNPVSS